MRSASSTLRLFVCLSIYGWLMCRTSSIFPQILCTAKLIFPFSNIHSTRITFCEIWVLPSCTHIRRKTLIQFFLSTARPRNVVGCRSYTAISIYCLVHCLITFQTFSNIWTRPTTRGKLPSKSNFHCLPYGVFPLIPRNSRWNSGLRLFGFQIWFCFCDLMKWNNISLA